MGKPIMNDEKTLLTDRDDLEPMSIEIVVNVIDPGTRAILLTPDGHKKSSLGNYMFCRQRTRSDKIKEEPRLIINRSRLGCAKKVFTGYYPVLVQTCTLVWYIGGHFWR